MARATQRKRPAKRSAATARKMDQQIIEIGPKLQQPAARKIVDDDLEKAEVIVKAMFLGGRSQYEGIGAPTSTDDASAPWGEEKSRALSADDWEKYAHGEYIPPLASPSLWSLTSEQNTRLGRCIRTFARNVCGLGYEIVYRYPDEVEASAEEKKLADEEIKKAEELFESPNDEMPFATLMEQMKIDEETIGNGWIEIVRNRKGDITQIHHVPGATIRWKKDLSGFIQIRGGVEFRGGTSSRYGRKKRYFKVFGDETQVDARSGLPFEGPVDWNYNATELLQFKIYSTRSSFYGVPRYIATAPAIAGNRYAAIRNVTFFENDATPRMLITINGGTLDDESMHDLRKFFEREHKGVANAHRVAIIQPESKTGLMGEKSAPVIRVVPLTVGNGEDGSFLRYSQATNEEVREAFGLSEVYFQSYNINRASAQVGAEMTNKQELDPDRKRLQHILNHKLLWGKKGMQLKRVKLQFTKFTMSTEGEQAVVDATLSGTGAITPNEIRQRHGLPSYPPEYTFADKPILFALEELKLGIAMAFAGAKPPATPQEATQRVQKIMEKFGLDPSKYAVDIQLPNTEGNEDGA